jgi:hypothetical protein
MQGNSHIYVQHPERNRILDEVTGAFNQPRYHRDRIDLQAEHYIRDWLYPDSELMLSGFGIYDAWDPQVQVMVLSCSICMCVFVVSLLLVHALVQRPLTSLHIDT